jgi:O-antigen/teichoic acid export membrane protein
MILMPNPQINQILPSMNTTAAQVLGSKNQQMSRLKHFTRSLVSSYMFLGVNVLYSLASIPLALKHLSDEEFGLWLLVQQIVHYIALVDMGMGTSVSRILIDHKDMRSNGEYGAAIKAGFMVCMVQGLIIILVGLLIAGFMGDWMRVSLDLQKPFFWLLLGHVIFSGLAFVTRMFSQILYAWQRLDIFNYAQSLQLVVAFSALWMGFKMGLGIYSLLLGAFLGWLCSAFICGFATWAINAWPKSGEWHRPASGRFRELFNYGGEVFVMAIGAQLIIASQTILIGRQLGPAATTLWGVMTKVFILVCQVIWRIANNAMPAFAEMQVRNEYDRLWQRYRTIFITTSVISAFCAILFAACNSYFVNIWMSNEYGWRRINDVLLAIWLIMLTQQYCHNTLLACLRKIRSMKYIVLAEGLVFIALALMMLNRLGISAMLVCSIVCTTAFTWFNGTMRVTQLINKDTKLLFWTWQLPMLRMMGMLIPFWLFLEWSLVDAPILMKLIINALSLTLAGVLIGLRYVLPKELIAEIMIKLPRALQRPLNIVSRHTSLQESVKKV